jgi:PAS domain S-box-containing protein/putative nucleotidyltransferase with HDIG domain
MNDRAQESAGIPSSISENIYKRVFETALDGILILGYPNGEVQAANPYLLNLLGYSAEEVIGLKLWELGFVVDRRRAEEAFDSLLNNNYVRYADIALRRKDGRILEVEFVSNVYTVNDKKAIQCNIRDISDRMTAERSLKAAQQQLVDSLYRTISCLSKLVESRDPYTMGHQARVAQLAEAISRKMQLREAEIDTVRLAGLIHDIGKVGIPVEILVKPNTLKAAELALLHSHSAAATQILLPLGLGDELNRIVLEHHERLDGSGYPNGLRNTEICLGARIIGVADTVEAMLNGRPYRGAKSLDEALDELQENAGLLYDPAVVETCITLFRDDGFIFSDTPLARQSTAVSQIGVQ